ncbi:MAG: YHS domain-containing (seleno)protein, partial [Pseudomonadota bacterium]
MRFLYAPIVAAALALVPLTDPEAFAGQDPVYQSFLGTAIDGTDPVAYFTEGKPVEGTSDHVMEWNSATWYFASAENLAKFAADPAKYAPQYGGYCAWAVSQGYTA